MNNRMNLLTTAKDLTAVINLFKGFLDNGSMGKSLPQIQNQIILPFQKFLKEQLQKTITQVASFPISKLDASLVSLDHNPSLIIKR